MFEFSTSPIPRCFGSHYVTWTNIIKLQKKTLNNNTFVIFSYSRCLRMPSCSHLDELQSLCALHPIKHECNRITQRAFNRQQYARGGRVQHSSKWVESIHNTIWWQSENSLVCCWKWFQLLTSQKNTAGCADWCLTDLFSTLVFTVMYLEIGCRLLYVHIYWMSKCLMWKVKAT